MNVKRLKDASWKRWRKVQIKDDGLANELRAGGIEVIDANEFVKRDSPQFLDLDAIPEPVPIFPEPPKANETHPNWHDRPSKVFNNACFPVEGIAQAELFTKSVQIKKGLPDALLELGHFTKLDDQDSLVQKVIKHSFLWDSYVEILPKLRNLEIPSFKFKADYGIPAKRANEQLIRNLLRLCETRVPSSTGQRVIGGEEEFRVNLERHNFGVQFNLGVIATIMSKNLLPPATTDSTVTLDKKLPNIFPFNSIVNFEETNIYEDGDFMAYKQDSPFPFIQTAFVSHHIPGSHTHIHPRWNNDRFSGTSILFNFATALLMARRKYGIDVKELPEPITTQGVHFTGKEFQFSVFQLNTLDLENVEESSLKNILWLTEKMNIFDNCRNDLGKEILEGYNPEVFKILMGFYATGSNLN